MKITIVVGARPNFMKAAPITAAIAEYNRRAADKSNGNGSTGPDHIQCSLVHTGQHYDARMSDAFFADLNMPQPDVFLGAGSGSHAVQTAEIMKRFEAVLLEQRPDVLVVVGDVNSTLACALVASKINFPDGQARPLIAHVEAGLRSCDRSMPEEINRVLTDHLCDFLFVTEESGLRNLDAEGIHRERAFFVGNTMIDSLLAYQEKAESSPVLDRLGLRILNGNGTRKSKPYVLLTLHRPANVDNPKIFREILSGLEELVAAYPVIFPAHPRTQKQIRQYGLESHFRAAGQTAAHANGKNAANGIVMIDPQGYLDFLCLMKHARLVVSDSGGIQEETTSLGVPCVTVRENTERPVTVDCGSNVLAGVRAEGIRKAIRQQLERKRANTAPYLWDGRAARRIVEILAREGSQPEVNEEALSFGTVHCEVRNGN
jgi:UDP-N-acetylglucosamine 2-epimerase (non-hydrolysing)